jgi:hypothetical protein
MKEQIKEKLLENGYDQRTAEKILKWYSANKLKKGKTQL